MPPLVEFTDSLLTGTGHDLDLRTFKLVDQLSGKMMGVRADITPQVARIDAHLLNSKGVTRLCYCGSVLHARPATPAASREPIQIGAELFGERGIAGDLEIQGLLCRALAVAGVKGARMDVGHVAVFRSLVRRPSIGHELEVELFEALQRKDAPALKALTRRTDAKTRAALLLLPDLYGGAEVLGLAREEAAAASGTEESAGHPACARQGVRRSRSASTSPSCAATTTTRAWCSTPIATACAGAVARGGRYDEVGKAFGRPRAATGFSIDLRSISQFERRLEKENPKMTGKATQRRRHRHPVGRRGQGQDRRLADRPRAGRGALPGRPQRRPHAGDRRRRRRCCT